MSDDQAFYDTLFSLRAAVVFLARESRGARERGQALAIRALRAEARARCLEIERDFWRRLHLNTRAVKLRSARRRKAA